MIQKKKPRYWNIRGMDGFETLFQYTIPFNHITEKRLKKLLQTLAAKIGLSEDEIISSYARKGTKSHQDSLEIRFSEGKQYMFSCGENPYVIAETEYLHLSPEKL